MKIIESVDELKNEIAKVKWFPREKNPLVSSNYPRLNYECGCGDSDSACFFEVHDVAKLSKMMACFQDCDNNPENLIDTQFSAKLMSEKYQNLYLEKV